MKQLIYLILATLTLAGNQFPAIARPTHNPKAKADEAQHYTVGLSLRGSGWGDGLKMRLTLAGHTATSNVSLNDWMGLQANDLRPGVYTATATFLGLPKRDMYGHETVDTTPLAGDGRAYQTLQISPWNAVKIISVGNSFSPPVNSEVGGQTTNMVWDYGLHHQPERFETKEWLSHNTINHIGDTCKIIFYLGPDAATYHVAKSSPPIKTVTPTSSPVSCPHYKEMLAEANALEKLADTLQTNDKAYQSAVVDILLQGYDSDYARLGLAVDEDDIANHFAYDQIPKIAPGEGSIVDARKNIVESIRSKANALKAIANAGIYNDYGLGDDGYLSKDAVQYFCSRDPKKLSGGAWEGLYKAGYIDYPTYHRIHWQYLASDTFIFLIENFALGKAWKVAEYAAPKLFEVLPFKFGNLSIGLDFAEAKTLSGLAKYELETDVTPPIARVFNSVSADSLNAEEVATAKARGQAWYPAWKDGTLIREVTLSRERSFVRVYWRGMKDGKAYNGQYGIWATFKPEDIEGLTAEQIKDKFALPSAPNYVCDVIASPGTKLRVGWAREQPQWKGTGGGRQLQIQAFGSSGVRYANERRLP